MRRIKGFRSGPAAGTSALAAILALVLLGVQPAAAQSTAGSGAGLPPRQMEYLDRGLVAVKVDNGVFLSWRMLGTDPDDIAFNIYRDGVKVNPEPIADRTNYVDPAGTIASTYQVAPVVGGEELRPSLPVSVWPQQYLVIPINQPPPGVTPTGERYTYEANDASVGDLDGDGQYEIVLKWHPTNAKDNAHDGYTGPEIFDAYELDGTHLWRITQGVNIRAGAHYTQFIVYDLDGDGKAEVAFRTADGTVDGMGNVIGDPNADYRDSRGRILTGPEYLTIFEGATGRALVTVPFEPARGNVNDWGDNYGNRSDRFLAAVAYLDGERPSLIMARGYYAKTMLVAYNYRDGELTKVWSFDSHDPSNPGNRIYAGQGNHNLSVADVDFDGKDEIIYGAMAIDDDGTGLYATGWGHGDAMHVGDLDPSRPGLEVFQVHESPSSPYGASFRDALTGQIIWGVRTGADTGRGTAADIDPNFPGAEAWASNGVGVRSATGELITTQTPSINFVVWWDGDLLRELLDNIYIDKWDPAARRPVRILTATGALSNNGTKATPALSADILGDWREEVIWRTADNQALLLYTTTDPTPHRIYTLMHDPQYRLAIAWQNVAYNQPPHPSFFLGEGMAPPPKPNIYLATGDRAGVRIASPTLEEGLLGVRGALDVVLEQSDPEAQIEDVTLNFGGLHIASVSRLPATLTVDTLAFPEGEHQMEVQVTLRGERPISIWRRVVVDNIRFNLEVGSGADRELRGRVPVRYDVLLTPGLSLAEVEIALVASEGGGARGPVAAGQASGGAADAAAGAGAGSAAAAGTAREVSAAHLGSTVGSEAGAPEGAEAGRYLVYRGAEVSGQVVLDTLRFPDGKYTLEITAWTTDGKMDRTGVDVVIENLEVAIQQPANRSVLSQIAVIVPRVEHADGLEFEGTTILLDGQVIYESARPARGLVIDTREYPDGLHRLTVIARAGGREERAEVELSFVNRWQLYDHLKPPVDGWFGLVDLRETIDESEGWGYATDNPADFFGDADRKVRLADTTEYLVWEAHDLETVTFDIYARDPEAALRAISAAASSDGENWFEIQLSAASVEASPSGWYKLVVVGENRRPSEFVRFTIHAHGGPADAIQIGRVHLVGFRE